METEIKTWCWWQQKEEGNHEEDWGAGAVPCKRESFATGYGATQDYLETGVGGDPPKAGDSTSEKGEVGTGDSDAEGNDSQLESR